jgi:cytochrome c oxidase assembly protein subunit 15
MSAVPEDDPIESPPRLLGRAGHVFAFLAVAFTLPLLSVGGTVTTYRVGLAVPDWPQTFGINMFLYEFWNAPFGVRVEHTHRLYGAAVGIATLLLAGWFLCFEPRRWLKALGILAVVGVITQGILGGLRVTQISTFLAAVHGAFGQAFFGLLVVLWVLTSKSFRVPWAALEDRDGFRLRAFALLGSVMTQIALGGWLRHYGTRGGLVCHGLVGLLVWGQGVLFLSRVRKDRQHLARLARSTTAVAAIATLQVVLGFASMLCLLPFDGMPRPVTFYQAVLRTGHQTTGALLLAGVITLVLVTCRQFAGLAAEQLAGGRAHKPGLPAERAVRDWEAVV